jgi:UDP-N-acetylglucosamine--dolichyl-phosphate N-acetylglucosaminephosphotransferase
MAEALPFIGAFLVAAAMTFLLVPWLIPKLKERGIVGKDLNKPGHPEIAEMGGIAVVIGFFAGVSVLLALDGIEDVELFYVSLSVVLGAAFIGMVDDIFDLRQRQKAFFPFLLALPLGAAIDPSIDLPYIGTVDLGAWMIIAAPFAITCAANAGNMLEGFNGLGTGLGIIMSATLIVLGVHHDRLDGLYLLVPILGGLVAFLWFNRYPAKVFPGDTLMLFMGAGIAAAGMLSELYIQTVVIFIPMILEFFLKFRGHFKAENYASDASNGHLEYHGKIESVTHVFMKKMIINEKRLVYAVWGLEILLCLLVVAIDVLA